MQIRLIFPRAKIFYGPPLDFPMQSLTLTYLAALTPSEFDVEMIDERITEIPYDKRADLVGISIASGTDIHAYEIAENYKRLGVPVILGGFHTSLFPEEALGHADAIVIGEAEDVWETLLSDVKKGKLKPVYKSETLSDLKNLPLPRYEYYDPADYSNMIPLFITRGCPYNCTYCCIKSGYGPSFRKRPIEDVVEQIKIIKEKYEKEDQTPPLSFFFVDDNLWGDVRYAKELFRSLIPLEIIWTTQASLTLDDELLELAAKSGCYSFLVGLESLDPRNVSYFKKRQNSLEHYEECIEKIHRAGISVNASFMVGLPYDDEHCFTTLLDFLEKNSVELGFVYLFMPIPGTEQFNQKDWEGACEVTDFESIVTSLPVFKPSNMTKKQFKRDFVAFQRRLFSDESIDKRLKNCADISSYFINMGHQSHYLLPEWDEWAEE